MKILETYINLGINRLVWFELMLYWNFVPFLFKVIYDIFILV